MAKLLGLYDTVLISGANNSNNVPVCVKINSFTGVSVTIIQNSYADLGGYIIALGFNNGLLIQWDFIDEDTVTSPIWTVTYPIAYTSFCVPVCIWVYGNSGGYGRNMGNVTLTSFTFYFSNTASLSIAWHCIGY